MKNLKQNFEEYAQFQLQNHKSELDATQLWEKIDAELRPNGRRLPPVWMWVLGIGLAAFLAGGAVYFYQFENEKTAAAQNVAAGMSVGNLPIGENQEVRNFSNSKKMENSTAEKPLVENRTAENFSNLKLASLENPAAEKPPVENQTAENFSNLKLASLENPAAKKPTVENRTAENLTTFKQVSNLEFLPISLVFLKNKAIPAPQKEPDPSSKCYSFGGSGFSLKPYFGIYGGASYPLKTLESRTDEFEALAARRRETETVLEAVQIGGFVGMKHPSGIFGEAGAEFQRINERFDWSSTRRDTFGQIAISTIIINAPGDTTFFKDTIDLVRETKTIKKTFNNYRTLSLPIAVGFEFNRGGRFLPYLKLGAAINLTFKQKAEIADATGRSQLFISENAGTDHPFRTKIGISPFVNVGARFHLKNGLSAFGEVRYLHHSTEITSENYPVRQKYGLPGANLGLVWGF